MTQADSVHSTPPTNTSAVTPVDNARPFYGAECPSYPNCAGGCGLGCTKEHAPINTTRRSFLAQAAAVAAGGAALGATLPLPGSAGASERALRDPVFAAIDAHKKPHSIVNAALDQPEQLFERAADDVGPSTISVLDMREPSNPPGWHPYVEALTYFDIDKFVRPEEHPELNKHYQEKLKERQAARLAFVGDDVDDICSDEMISADSEAASGLAEVIPTTVSGLLALLAYLGKAHREQSELFGEDDYESLFRSLAQSAQALLRQPRENFALNYDSAALTP